jgi:hypothetical protein
VDGGDCRDLAVGEGRCFADLFQPRAFEYAPQ